MAVVEFVPADFRELYPQFTEALISDGQLTQAFNVACLLLDNSDSSPVPYNPATGVLVRQTLLNLLVCHLATLALWSLHGPTGRISGRRHADRPTGRRYRHTSGAGDITRSIIITRGGR